MRTLSALLTTLALAGVVTTGCSSSSTTPITSSDSGTDGGETPDAHGGKGDSGKPGTDGSMPTDGGKCNFATFVIGLIDKDTTPTAVPSTNLGASCTDDQKQSDFASLFK
jgi:hypothetical protein